MCCYLPLLVLHDQFELNFVNQCSSETVLWYIV